MEAIQILKKTVSSLFNNVDRYEVTSFENTISVRFNDSITDSDFINIQEIHKATQLKVEIYTNSHNNLICKFYLCQ